MITKPVLIHHGWSHTNGEDMYDNISIGSTKEARSGDKLDQKSMKLKKNSENGIIGISGTDTDTDVQGWTTIKANGRRKPKTTTMERPIIDSIITTIDVETMTVQDGVMEVRIESPERRNRCIIPDTTEREDETAYEITKQPMEQEEEEEKEEEDDEEEDEDEEEEKKQKDVNRNDNKKNDNNRCTTTDGIVFELNKQNQQRLLPPGTIEDNAEKKKNYTVKEEQELKKENNENNKNNKNITNTTTSEEKELGKELSLIHI